MKQRSWRRVGSGAIVPPFMSGQPHAPAALPAGKELQVSVPRGVFSADAVYVLWLTSVYLEDLHRYNFAGIWVSIVMKQIYVSFLFVYRLVVVSCLLRSLAPDIRWPSAQCSVSVQRFSGRHHWQFRPLFSGLLLVVDVRGLKFVQVILRNISCGDRSYYLHRSPASRKTRRKRNPVLGI
jgi:hypothetical protein